MPQKYMDRRGMILYELFHRKINQSVSIFVSTLIPLYRAFECLTFYFMATNQIAV